MDDDIEDADYERLNCTEAELKVFIAVFYEEIKRIVDQKEEIVDKRLVKYDENAQ